MLECQSSSEEDEEEIRRWSGMPEREVGSSKFLAGMDLLSFVGRSENEPKL